MYKSCCMYLGILFSFQGLSEPKRMYAYQMAAYQRMLIEFSHNPRRNQSRSTTFLIIYFLIYGSILGEFTLSLRDILSILVFSLSLIIFDFQYTFVASTTEYFLLYLVHLSSPPTSINRWRIYPRFLPGIIYRKQSYSLDVTLL